MEFRSAIAVLQILGFGFLSSQLSTDHLVEFSKNGASLAILLQASVGEVCSALEEEEDGGREELPEACSEACNGSCIATTTIGNGILRGRACADEL